jgi:superfamily II DNA or RNA helicase
MNQLAPGARVLIRDEEWLIRRVDPSTDGGWLLTCDGISDLVKSHTALFLTALEDEIEILDPAETLLVPDQSPTFNATMLYLESHRRRVVPNDISIHLGHRGVMNVVPYQLDPAIQALRQPRARILIADAVGLGKTLEAAVLATELIQRGRGKRILVVTQKAMLTQFQKEWWSRFSIPLVRLDSTGLARVRNRIPANHNPFNYFDRSIISIDTLKSNLEYRNYLENAWWDMIVIDECHNVAARAGEQGIAKRAKLARLLATRSDTLILLSATPHDGSARSFASLMALLDPTAISDPDEYTPADFKEKGLVIRRFKKDIKDQVTADFQERITICLRQKASAIEEAAYRALLAIPFTQNGAYKAGKQQELQRVAMQKGLFSSPAAAHESALKRIQLLKNKSITSKDEEHELACLSDFVSALKPLVQPESDKAFSKYQKLLEHLKSPEFAWDASSAGDRLVIFSERIETLRWLQTRLSTDLRLKIDKQIAILHGGMGDTEQQEMVERFGRQDDTIRVLLCSDVASEGLNLHYFCHRLVHFDLPWSLMVFQQRNGRIDRYGQKHEPQILYLFTEAGTEKIKGDLRILEILQSKDDQANKNLGDPSAFLNVFDPEKEAAKVGEFMAAGQSPEQVEASLDSAASGGEENEGDWLLELFGGRESSSANESMTSDPGGTGSLSAIHDSWSLFEGDYEYAKTALKVINQEKTVCQWSSDDDEQIVNITAPIELQERLRQLPREVQASQDHYALCADKDRVAEAIEQSRQAKAEADTWPQLHYLWRQHPIIEWLGDRLLSYFGRHSAPLLQSPNLQVGEQAFLFMSLIPNKKAQPLVVEWQVASRTQPDAEFQLEPFELFAERAGLRVGVLPNAGVGVAYQRIAPLMQAALPQAVDTMRNFMSRRQAEFAAGLDGRLAQTLSDLKQLQEAQILQLELRLDKQIEAVKRSRFESRSRQIGRVFDDYRQWVHDTLTTEPRPWIQVLAAVCHPTAGV